MFEWLSKFLFGQKPLAPNSDKVNAIWLGTYGDSIKFVRFDKICSFCKERFED